MGDIEWTEAHRVEAWARLLELHATKVRERGVTPDIRGTSDLVKDEHATRETLGMFMDAARVDREVRRVDGFATGRLVRESVVFIVWNDGRRSKCTRLSEAKKVIAGRKAAKMADCGRLLRATHIRKVT